MSDKPASPESGGEGNSSEGPSMPDISLKGMIKSGVDVTNKVLAGVGDATEGIRQPMNSAWNSVASESSTAGGKARYYYQRRHEFAPHIIGGSALVGAGFFGLRRGRIAGVVGGVAAGGLAYGAVYDQFNIDTIPDILFGKK